MTNDIDIVEEQDVYQGFFRLTQYRLRFRLFAGEMSGEVSRELLRHPGAVGILLFDPNEQKVVLVEQFRIGLVTSAQSPWLLEIVAGLIDKEETPQVVAKREAEEEAGLIVDKIVPICRYWTSPGCSEECIHLFIGSIDSQQAPQFAGLASESEDIKIHVLSIEQALQNLALNKYYNAPTIISLQWLQLNRDKLESLFTKDK